MTDTCYAYVITYETTYGTDEIIISPLQRKYVVYRRFFCFKQAHKTYCIPANNILLQRRI